VAAAAEVNMLRGTLLWCGIVSSVLYGVMTAIIATRWPGYSSASQTISELSAIGAPTRALWVSCAAFYTVLVAGFGCGVWTSAGRRRGLRVAGASIVAYGSLGLLWPFAPMHLRELLAAGGGTVSDTVHLTLAGVTVVLMIVAMVSAATAFGVRVRLCSAASLAILFVCGALTFAEAPNVGANLPTPWIGVWERINVGVFLIWVIVLAAALLRAPQAATQLVVVAGSPRSPTTGVPAIENWPCEQANPQRRSPGRGMPTTAP
jgi:hypothetical protein